MRDHLIVLSASHERANVAVRERLSVSDDRLPDVLARPLPALKELAILATCNRTEFYAVVAPGQCPARLLRRHVAGLSAIPEDDLDPVADIHLDADAVRHLLRVASGLDSLVLGEPHILGQVRSAFERAREHGASGPILARLGTEALTVGKRVRTATGLARNRSTIPHVAIDLAVRYIGPLASMTAVVVGAGEMGTLAAQVLRGVGVGRLVIVNRSEARGRALAERATGTYRPLSDLPDAIGEADLVIAAAGGSRGRITPHVLDGAARGERPLVVIDLGMPRQVDSAVAGLAGVTVLNLDDLAPVADERRREAAGEAAIAERMIETACDGFARWWAQRAAVPTIAAMRDKAERIREAELERALRRLGHLSERDRNVVAALSVGIVNKLLHEPTSRLREDADGELAAAALRLFGLDDAAGATHPDLTIVPPGNERRGAA